MTRSMFFSQGSQSLGEELFRLSGFIEFSVAAGESYESRLQVPVLIHLFLMRKDLFK